MAAAGSERRGTFLRPMERGEREDFGDGGVAEEGGTVEQVEET